MTPCAVSPDTPNHFIDTETESHELHCQANIANGVTSAYLARTTIHGLDEVFAARTRFQSIAWIIILVAAAFATGALIINLAVKLQNPPMVTRFTLAPIDPYPPDVMYCSPDFINVTSIRTRLDIYDTKLFLGYYGYHFKSIPYLGYTNTTFKISQDQAVWNRLSRKLNISDKNGKPWTPYGNFLSRAQIYVL